MLSELFVFSQYNFIKSAATPNYLVIYLLSFHSTMIIRLNVTMFVLCFRMTHEVFGDVKKFISQDLVRQGYLLHERLGLSDPPVYEYKWGPRAKYETSKRNILDFVYQVKFLHVVSPSPIRLCKFIFELAG